MLSRAVLLLAVLSAPSPGAVEGDADFLERVAAAPELAVESAGLGTGLTKISAVTVDGQGYFYVLHRPEKGDPVVVLSPEGERLRSWGAGLFKTPHGIRVDPDGKVWTIDSSTSKVSRFTDRGELELEIDIDVPNPEKDFCGASDIAFPGDGHVLVADGYCNGRVLEFDGRGQKVREWGSRGSGEGQFDVAHSIAVSREGVVYVADRENGRLQRFDRAGRFLGLWNYARQLYGVALGPKGELFISVLMRNPRRPYVLQIDPETGDILGKIVGPFGHEISVTPSGDLLAAPISPRFLRLRRESNP
ncbi:MAG: hypothetical protein AAF690_04620 [Acidobacteriota bacterium]